MSFATKLEKAAALNRSLLCIGLDPDPDQMPIADLFEFNRAIIEATSDLVCAYKPNLGFYECLGHAGYTALERTLECIPPHIPIIGDAKRGDVQPTSRFYAKALFESWGFDAVTVNPYGGQDTIEPFLDYPEKGVIVWCRSSNPGAKEFQDVPIIPPGSDTTCLLYEWVAMRAAAWNKAGNVGVVAGATYPQELRRVREICPDMVILVPGIGPQEGALEQSVENGVDENGRRIIISASRGVLYASKEKGLYPEAARKAADTLRKRINTVLSQRGYGWPEL
jgi:orotidine-5'-phosphate decarboxylase